MHIRPTLNQQVIHRRKWWIFGVVGVCFWGAATVGTITFQQDFGWRAIQETGGCARLLVLSGGAGGGGVLSVQSTASRGQREGQGGWKNANDFRENV